MIDDPRYCPKCNADLQGAPIPPDDIAKGYFGGPDVTHFSRLIGVEDSAIYDGIIRWECPDCRYSWPRKGMEKFSE